MYLPMHFSRASYGNVTEASCPGTYSMPKVVLLGHLVLLLPLALGLQPRWTAVGWNPWESQIQCNTYVQTSPLGCFWQQ
jgi:hypothetical protein